MNRLSHSPGVSDGDLSRREKKGGLNSKKTTNNSEKQQKSGLNKLFTPALPNIFIDAIAPHLSTRDLQTISRLSSATRVRYGDPDDAFRDVYMKDRLRVEILDIFEDDHLRHFVAFPSGDLFQVERGRRRLQWSWLGNSFTENRPTYVADPRDRGMGPEPYLIQNSQGVRTLDWRTSNRVDDWLWKRGARVVRSSSYEGIPAWIMPRSARRLGQVAVELVKKHLKEMDLD